LPSGRFGNTVTPKVGQRHVTLTRTHHRAKQMLSVLLPARP
jgi:hypothetical protein